MATRMDGPLTNFATNSTAGRTATKMFHRGSQRRKYCRGSSPARSHGRRANNVMISILPLKDRAQGRWSRILPALGIGQTFLTGKHGPCPLCGGKDRWRWDNLEGRGTWICSKCGAGDGISLVMRKNGWEFSETAKRIEAVIGSTPTDAPKRARGDREKRDAMNKLWASSKVIDANDPSGRYLHRRV